MYRGGRCISLRFQGAEVMYWIYTKKLSKFYESYLHNQVKYGNNHIPTGLNFYEQRFSVKSSKHNF
ncbi:hypothetical protein ANA_C11776 [Anabaena sp. 90]|nr:hypothetical protein ANA_C11776 [Anabaena sp. 90]